MGGRLRLCSIPGCERVHHARGWCGTHYQRVRVHGSTEDPRPSREERFWAKVDKNGPEVRPGLGRCWVWTASTRGGYGEFGVAGTRTTGAHRFAYELLVGPIPDGHQVCHHCDNPSCVNPDHLFTGTNLDNVRDMIAKGRHVGAPRGEDHHLAVLDSDKVRRIRELYAEGASLSELGRRFGVTGATIGSAVRRETWTEVA